ncbi:MAG: hypothetical protein Q7R78_01220 [bacterium]|nr:hypothetical protein [bacterium]
MKYIKYEVIFEAFAERHFIKTFSKKYKGAWDFTLKFLYQEFEQIDLLFLKNTAEYITNKDANVVICKTEFKISGTKESRHGSGNRCITVIHKDISKVKVLLVYHKNDLKSNNETVSWKSLVKENYPDYRSIL